MKKMMVCLAVLFLFVGMISTASAVPVQFSGNGHYYEVVTTYEAYDWWNDEFYTTNFNRTWLRANMYSDDYSYLGETSYFATVTSQEENDFIASLVHDANVTSFLGGRQASSGAEPAGGWYWAATGEAMTYFNWAPGEPNDVGYFGEDYLEMYTNGTWNDIGTFSRNQAYVVEYDGTAPVPEPGTLLLLGSGLAGLALYRRKKAAK